MVDPLPRHGTSNGVTESPRRRVSMVGQRRRAAILDAAMALIVDRGLEGFRVREVAQRANLHHATLLHYFPNRAALLQAVVDRIVAQLDHVPRPTSAGTHLAPREILTQHFAHVYWQTRTVPEQFVVLNELFVRASRDADARAVLHATEISWMGFLVPLLEQGMRAGQFRADLDAPAAATMIVGFFRGSTLQLDLTAAQLRAALDQLLRWIVIDGDREEADHGA